MAEQGLKEKTVKGIGWSGIDNIAQFVVSFIVSIILARLLSPDDYGLLGIVAIFSAVCNALIGGGFSLALIRKNDVTEDDYNTAFVVNFGMSLFLYVVIFFCAPLIADYFGREELVQLVRLSSVGMIIGALAMVQRTRLTKQINFKSQTKITIISSILSGTIGVVMAFLGCGVWSLVFQGLSNQFFNTLFLWFFNNWIPKLRFTYSCFKNLFGFGWKMMVSTLIDTIWRELYQVVVGKFYTPATLGQFTRAQQFSNLFSSNLTNVIQRVTYPVLSDIQEDKTRMVAAYRKIIKETMFISSICMFFLGAISEPLLYCLIGPKWHDAAVYLPLICIMGSLYPLHAINLNMLQVLGRSDIFLKLEILKKTIAIGPFIIGAFVGIIPMLYASIVVNVICFFLNSFYTGRDLGYSSWMQIKDVSNSFGIAVIVALSVYFLKYLPFNNWVILFIQICLGFSVIYLLCTKLNVEEYKELKIIVTPILIKIRLKNGE